VPRRVCELELASGVDPSWVLAEVAGATPDGPARSEDRVLVDTFDGRLHAAGVVRGEGEPVADALRAGRALLPVARVRSRAGEFVVRNGDAKIVVRLRAERPEVVGDGDRPVPLPARVTVREVLGYADAYEEVLARLKAADGLVETGRSLLAAASWAVGRDPAGVDGKVRLSLGRSGRAGDAARELLLQLADVAEANVPGALDDLDVEFLHDLRVAVRRARSVLRELAAVFPPDALAHVRAELKWLQAATGPVRDLDVQLADLDVLTEGLSDARRADLDALRALLWRHRATQRRKLRAALRGRRAKAALESWRTLATQAAQGAGAADRPVAELAAERIRHVHRRMVRDGSHIDDASPPEALHDLRKRGKELRYLLELFGPLFAADVVRSLVRALKELQDVLGRFQDRAVQIEVLEAVAGELAGADGGPSALMALGLLVEELRADQERARDEFRDRFERFAAKDQRALVKRSFA